MRLSAFTLLPAMAMMLPATQALAQTLTPTVITPLSTSLNETSGLLIAGGTVWTQLDGGNPQRLYQVDTTTGAVLREVELANAANADWEDMETDGNWVYVGDFGNNSGSRTDLRIYRFPLDSLLDASVDSVMADTIRFAYADQVDFTPAPNATNFDCEAFVAADDSLFLFTKNWLDSRTALYALPATPGDHLAQRRDTLDAQGLVTGATRDPLTGAVALIGYTNSLFVPFVWELGGYPGDAFFDGSAVRHALTLAFVQMEAIAWSGPGSVFITNEQSPLSPARLWRLDLDFATAVVGPASTGWRAFPNPTTGPLHLADVPEGATAQLFDLSGRPVTVPLLALPEVDLGGVPEGIYQLVIQGEGRIERVAVIVAR